MGWLFVIAICFCFFYPAIGLIGLLIWCFCANIFIGVIATVVVGAIWIIIQAMR